MLILDLYTLRIKFINCYQYHFKCISWVNEFGVPFLCMFFHLLPNQVWVESIQGIRKGPTYRFEDPIVWERWHFRRSAINIDYRLIQCIIVLIISLPIFKLSLQVPWIIELLESILIKTGRPIHIVKSWMEKTLLWIMIPNFTNSKNTHTNTHTPTQKIINYKSPPHSLQNEI